MVHVHVHAHIALALAAAVVHRLIHREQPPELPGGDDRLHLLALQQIRQHVPEVLVELHHLARLAPRHVGGVRVKDDLAAVRQDLVGVDVLDAVRAAGQIVEALVDPAVALGLLAEADEFLHPVAVDGDGRNLRHTPGELLLLLHGGGAVVDEADRRDDGAGDNHARGHQHHDLGAQGQKARPLFAGDHFFLQGQGVLLPARIVQALLKLFGQNVQQRRHHKHGDGFVHNVHDHIRRELGQELAFHTAGIKLPGKCRRGPDSELKPVQHPGQQRPETAADEGEHRDHRQQSPGLAEAVIAVACKPGGGNGDQDGE